VGNDLFVQLQIEAFDDTSLCSDDIQFAQQISLGEGGSGRGVCVWEGGREECVCV
jgi:hypothetical protein